MEDRYLQDGQREIHGQGSALVWKYARITSTYSRARAGCSVVPWARKRSRSRSGTLAPGRIIFVLSAFLGFRFGGRTKLEAGRQVIQPTYECPR